jgi:hypothetical protein
MLTEKNKQRIYQRMKYWNELVGSNLYTEFSDIIEKYSTNENNYKYSTSAQRDKFKKWALSNKKFNKLHFDMLYNNMDLCMKSENYKNNKFTPVYNEHKEELLDMTINYLTQKRYSVKWDDIMSNVKMVML